MKREKGNRYAVRQHAQAERKGRKENRRLEEDPLAVSKIFG